MIKHTFVIILSILFSLPVAAQVGEHRNDFAVGVNGGVNLTKIAFLPEVPQDMYQGLVFGLQGRYTCEKYFSTICSIQLELNYAQLGWKEKIQTIENLPVTSNVTGISQEYSRTINYIQIPFLAHLAWGKEHRGFNFFFNAGPQFGFMISESTKKTFDIANAMNHLEYPERASKVVAQDTMAVENKFDYGIAAGVGVELHLKHLGRLQLEGRYYYGLGNIYGDSKRDYFASSNHGVITIRAAYLIDL